MLNQDQGGKGMLARCTLKWGRPRKPVSSLLLFLLAIAFAIIPGSAFAASTANGQAPAAGPRLPQPRFQRPGRQGTARVSSIDRRVARLGTQLGLNDVQRFDLKRLLETQQAETNRLWNNQEIDPIDRMTRLRILQENTRKRFNALLTEEQRKKYEQLRQKAAQPAPQPQASKSNLQ